MDSPSVFVRWYAVATTGLILLSFSILVLRYAIICAGSALSFLFVKHFVYRIITIGSSTGVRIAPIDAFGTMIVIFANVACASWNVDSAQQLSLRCASLLATNLVFLLLGMDLVTQCLQITRNTYQKCHTVLAAIAVLEGIVHTAIELSKPRWPDSKVLISGVIVGSLVCGLEPG